MTSCQSALPQSSRNHKIAVSSLVSHNYDNIMAAFEAAESLKDEMKFTEALGAYDKLIYYIIGLSVDGISNLTDDLRSHLQLAFNNRGQVKYLQVEFPAAVEDYTASLGHGESAVTYYNRGLVHYRLARFQEGVSDMGKALTLDPEFAPAQQCREECLRQLAATQALTEPN